MVDQCKQKNDESKTGTMQEPLLPREGPPPLFPASASNANSEDGVTNATASNLAVTDDNQTDRAAATTKSSHPSTALLGCCTLALVLVGLGIILLCALLPLALYGILACIFSATNSSFSAHDSITIGFLFPCLLVLQCIHLWCLWISARYLCVIRTLVLPIRRIIFPLVPMVARIESIREKESTQYYAVPSPAAGGGEVPVFRKSVRRHYRRMQKIYQNRSNDNNDNNDSSIKHICVRAERNLVLRDVIPILWEHQQRTTQQSWPLEDFIKRVLVVTLVPDGILDLYYMKIPDASTRLSESTDDTHREDGPPQATANDNPSAKQLVCFQFSILQGNVWHWFMYFCRTEATRSGLWWHGALLAIHRGHLLSRLDSTGSHAHDDDETDIWYWVNAQTHQRDSKLHAGYQAANPPQNTDENHTPNNNCVGDIKILEKIYPWGVTARQIPSELLEVRLWEDQNE